MRHFIGIPPPMPPISSGSLSLDSFKKDTPLKKRSYFLGPQGGWWHFNTFSPSVVRPWFDDMNPLDPQVLTLWPAGQVVLLNLRCGETARWWCGLVGWLEPLVMVAIIGAHTGYQITYNLIYGQYVKSLNELIYSKLSKYLLYTHHLSLYISVYSDMIYHDHSLFSTHSASTKKQERYDFNAGPRFSLTVSLYQWRHFNFLTRIQIRCVFPLIHLCRRWDLLE